jgi:hypothetical protein
VIGLLLISTVAAFEPVTRPEPPEVVPNECPSVVGVDVGDAAPGWWFINDSATCAALIVPLSHYQDLLLTESWAEMVARRHEIDTTMLITERDWYLAEVERLQQPVPLFSRPATIATVGALTGVAVVVATAWSLSAIDN